MARAQFDREDVIKKALKLFWKHGYSATSMQQLIMATGLKPGSIYLAFGNKEGLFKEALELYFTKSQKITTDTINSASSVGKGICKVLIDMVNETNNNDFNSCFLIKTQLELSNENKKLFSFVMEKLKQRENLFCDYIKDEWGSEVCKQRAASIMLNMYGIKVYGYNKNSTQKIISALKDGLQWLPWDQTRDII